MYLLNFFFEDTSLERLFNQTYLLGDESKKLHIENDICSVDHSTMAYLHLGCGCGCRHHARLLLQLAFLPMQTLLPICINPLMLIILPMSLQSDK